MSRFCRIMATKEKKEEKFVFLTDNVTQGSKTKYEKKNLVAENENQQLEDSPQADFGREHQNISLVGKEKVNN